jgi:molybdopterin-binding protein
MARIEIDATEPARPVAIVTRESAEELGLKPGVSAPGVGMSSGMVVR